MGRGQTHKTQILDLYLSGYQFSDIHKRTHHSETAIKRYIQDFARVVLLHKKSFSISQIRIATGFYHRLIGEYLKLFKQHSDSAHLKRILQSGNKKECNAMNVNTLQFIPRDTRDQSLQAFAQRRYNRIKGKSLKHILLDRFLNQYGYDKGTITASAIIDDLLSLIEQFYRYRDNSFLKQGQLVWLAVPVDEYPKKAKSIAQTKLKPVVLDIITDSDIEDIKHMMHHREVRMKKIESAVGGDTSSV